MRLMLSIVALALTSLVAQTPASPWTIQAVAVNVTFRGVSAASDTIAWASGSRATVLRTTDAGQTWTPTPVVEAPATLDFRDVDAVGPDAVYLLSIGNGEA